MSNAPTPLDLPAIHARAEAVQGECCDISDDAAVLRIPAVCEDSIALCAEVERLRAENARLRVGLRRVADRPHHGGCPAWRSPHPIEECDCFISDVLAALKETL